MSQHHLQGRTESEVLWFRRRGFVQAAAAWVTLGGAGTAAAQQRGNIVQLQGDALLNGRPVDARNTVVTGDLLQTGPASSLQFVIGNAAFHVRQNSRLVVERGSTLNTVSALRMLTGAVVSVWGRGIGRQIITPTLTAGIRGTGVYTEVFPDGRSYFCNCYGTVSLQTIGRDRAVSQADYHEAYWAQPAPKDGRLLIPGDAINHTDEELEFLAQLVGQRTAWQVLGRKGVKDASGYGEPPPPPHPSQTPPVR